jgi:hypothetical protein
VNNKPKRIAILAYLRLRAEGHTAGCQCHKCAEARPLVLAAGEWRLVYDMPEGEG